MHPELINAHIRMSGTTAAALADELGVSRSMVAHVIHGRFMSARIRARIAEVTGTPVEKLWPLKPASGLRRAGARPATHATGATA